MGRTGHRWHYEECPHCHTNEKVQNRSYRYVAPNNATVTSYNSKASHQMFIEAGGELHERSSFRRTTIHRISCAAKRGIPAYKA